MRGTTRSRAFSAGSSDKPKCKSGEATGRRDQARVRSQRLPRAEADHEALPDLHGVARRRRRACRRCARRSASAASSHTGALAGKDKIYEDVFNRSGVIRARSLRDMLGARRGVAVGISPRHSGATPTGPADGRPDDRLRVEPGISRGRHSGMVRRTRPGISRFRVRSLRSRPGMTNSGIGPIQPGSESEADTGCQRIDDKILEPRVPSGDKELQQFECPDHDD